MMSCASTNALEPDDPGWEVDAGASDAARVQPSNQFWTNPGPVNPPCFPTGYCSTYPAGSACAGTGAWAQCSGVRSACLFQCAGACTFAPRAVAETCNGFDDDCDMAVDENPSVLCDDGYDCTTDSCMGAAGCSSPMLATCQEIRRPVSESRIAPDGVTWLMRQDNPRLTGRVISRVDDESFYGSYFSMVHTMSPVAAAIIGNGYNTIEPGNGAAGWLYSENPEGAAAAIGPFRAPQVVLNIVGPTDIALYRFPGTTGAYQWLDQIRMEIDPNVLVVPIRATAFVPSATPGVVDGQRLAFQQVFDPALVRSLSFGTTATSATATSHTLLPGLPPDDIWTQCDIQFRLVETRVVQNATLASTVATSCNCQGSSGIIGFVGARTPLGTYIDSVGGTNQTALDIFVGGDILNTGPNCNSGVVGQACGPNIGCNNSTVSGSSATSDQFWGTTVEAAALYSIPHELGHMLGLGHAFDENASNMRSAPQVPACVPGFSAPYANNLMGNMTQSGPLVPAQCGRARCVAARWLERFAPSAASTARRVAVCAGG